jgi:hypothetical protein
VLGTYALIICLLVGEVNTFEKLTKPLITAQFPSLRQLDNFPVLCSVCKERQLKVANADVEPLYR